MSKHTKAGFCVALVLLVAAGCGDDGGTGAGGGSTSSQTSSSTTGGATTTGATGSMTTSTGMATGSTSTGMQGDGSCIAPVDITLPFSVTGDTASALDATAPPCAPEPLPEAVYRLTLGAETTVNITASDNSGQGVGVQVKMTDCMGTSVSCDWAANGNLDRELTLPAGTWVIVVERRPAGSFDFSVQ